MLGRGGDPVCVQIDCKLPGSNFTKLKTKIRTFLSVGRGDVQQEQFKQTSVFTVDQGQIEFEPNRPVCWPLSCAASTGPILSYAGSVSTLMARPDFLQFPAYHRAILPTPLGQFSVYQKFIKSDRVYFKVFERKWHLTLVWFKHKLCHYLKEFCLLLTYSTWLQSYQILFLKKTCFYCFTFFNTPFFICLIRLLIVM